MILPDDCRAAQDRERRAARIAAALAAGREPPPPIRRSRINGFRVKARYEIAKSKAKPPRPTRPPAEGTCRCGCGQRPILRRSVYLPGHDSRHRAALAG